MEKEQLILAIKDRKFVESIEAVSEIVAGKKVPIIIEVSNQSYTDSKKIHLGMPYFLQKEIYDLVDLYGYCRGVNIHESSHIRYSNFNAIRDFLKDVYKKYRNKKGFENYTMAFVKYAKRLDNALEDGRIELLDSMRFHAHINVLKFLRAIWYNESCILLDEKSEAEELEDMIISICSIATIGIPAANWEMQYLNTEADRLLTEITPLIKKAVISPTHKELNNIALEIIEHLEDFIKDRSVPDDKSKSNSQKQQRSSSSQCEEDEGLNEEADGRMVESTEENNEEANSTENQESTKEEDSVEDDEGSEKESKQDSEELEEEAEDAVSAIEYDEKDGLGVGTLADSEEEEEVNEEDRDFYQGIKISTSITRKEIEREFDINGEDKQQSEAKPKQNFEIFYDEGEAEYDRIEIRRYNLKPTVSKYGDEIFFFKNRIQDILMMKSAKISKGRKCGRLDTANMWKTALKDKNVFERVVKGGDSSFCISILVDSSGSMAGELMESAVKTCIILEEVLKDIVPLQIAFFTNEGFYHLHKIIKDFDDKSEKGSYVNSYDASAFGRNKDGVHIKYAIEQLKLRQEKNKFLIVLSDGLPSMYPGQQAGIMHVHEVVTEGEKSGVKTVCIAIGRNMDSILSHKTYYKQMYKYLILAEGKDIYNELANLIQNLF